jgi:anaerobic magnesium-protoporphyrin IX monomethyl ester cyclase
LKAAWLTPKKHEPQSIFYQNHISKPFSLCRGRYTHCVDALDPACRQNCWPQTPRHYGYDASHTSGGAGMKKVLLLNPPGKQLYIRDYYCSKVSQADYINQPVDLLVISGILDTHVELHALDAIAGALSIESTLAGIRTFHPDVIIVLMGAVSLTEDTAFIKQVRAILPQARIVCTGDIFGEAPEQYLLTIPEIDAALTDFTSPDILEYITGTAASFETIVTRTGGGHLLPALSTKPHFLDAVPRHDLFARFNYRHPFIRGRRFATTLIDFGCPFQCSFCIMKTLPYRTRPVDAIMRELHTIKAMGITEILFDTQTFGANKAHALEVCTRMVDEKLHMGWVCFSRVDITTPDMLSRMQKAGCHTIIYGVESGSAHILKKYQKGYTPEQIHRTIDYASSIGLETVGTFILGLPEEDETTMRETLDTLRRIRLDYASFNVAVPRAGTELRKEAIDLGFIKNDFTVMDQSGTEVALPTKSLTREDIRRFRQQAVRTFYFRPSYLLKRLTRIRSPYDLLRTISQGLSLVQRTWKGS